MPRLAAVITLGAALVGLQACAGATPPGVIAAKGLPGRIEGTLTSAPEYRPLTAAEMADPVIRAGVERCKRQGDDNCLDKRRPSDRRESFKIGVDPSVFAMFRSSRLPAGAVYQTGCRLLGPGGSVVQTSLRDLPVVVPLSVTPDVRLVTTCRFDLEVGMPAGWWTVEFVIDGKPACALPFELLAGDGAGGVTT